MSKELNELIQGLGKLVDGYKNTAQELDKLKSLYEQLKLNFDEEFKCPFQENKPYWLVDEKGGIHGLKWDDEWYDRPRYEQGHVFKTQEEAERERDKRTLLTRFRQFRDQCNGEWKPDFEDLSQLKYVCYYDYHEKNLVCFDYFGEANNFNIFGYFKNGKDCERAIELFGKEIKRLFVEE